MLVVVPGEELTQGGIVILFVLIVLVAFIAQALFGAAVERTPEQRQGGGQAGTIILWVSVGAIAIVVLAAA